MDAPNLELWIILPHEKFYEPRQNTSFYHLLDWRTTHYQSKTHTKKSSQELVTSSCKFLSSDQTPPIMEGKLSNLERQNQKRYKLVQNPAKIPKIEFQLHRNVTFFSTVESAETVERISMESEEA
uniref:Uncharacterized protein n=1 Tax=Noccaea caerulescens TaxID=107243 RepID=A0A1J3CX89_NOCCA